MAGKNTSTQRYAKAAVTVNKPETDKGGSPALPLPHDRDESTTEQQHPVDPAMEQARQDVKKGLQDTDLRGNAAAVFDNKWSRRKRD